MDDLERIFNRFDANGDGRISSSELSDVLKALGSDTSPEEIKRMMAEIDADGDGFIDLKEFVDFHQKGGNHDDNLLRELRDAFDMYDKDKNGQISANELHLVLNSLGEKCSVEDCSRMISSVDKDGDGSVSFEEFKLMMSNSQPCPQ